jgi:hypothetical protein
MKTLLATVAALAALSLIATPTKAYMFALSLPHNFHGVWCASSDPTYYLSVQLTAALPKQIGDHFGRLHR